MSFKENKIIRKAYDFASEAHGSIGQVRKYSGQPYIVHPVGVASIVAAITDDYEMIAAALLHDTVEDTPVTLELVHNEFGSQVAALVDELTDVSRPEDGNRTVRKTLDREHSASASIRGKTVKLADLIHNSRSILVHDRDFAVIYLAEKRMLLDQALREGDQLLWETADRIVRLGHALLDG